MAATGTSTQITARIIGVLFLLAAATSIVGFSLFQTLVNGPHYLGSLYLNRSTVTMAVLLHLINDAAVAAIAVLMFLILKKYNKTVAPGYLSTRILEAGILVIGGISLLLLITISQEYMKAAATDITTYQALTDTIKDWQGWCYETAFIATGAGGLMLCCLLYSAQLVPRIMVVLGIIGYTLLLAKSMVDILHYHAAALLFIPVALFAFIFPVWLVVKGFDFRALFGED